MDVRVNRTAGFTDEQWTGAFVSVLRFARKVSAAPRCRVVSAHVSERLNDVPTGLLGTGVEYFIVLETPLGQLERYSQLGPSNLHRSFTNRLEKASTPWREMHRLNTGAPVIHVDFLKEFPRHHKMLSFHFNQWLWKIPPPQHPNKEGLIQEMFRAIGKVETEPDSELERVLLEGA